MERLLSVDDAAKVLGTTPRFPRRLIAEARLDLEGSATAREAWRLVKSDSIGVSFGYVAQEVDGGDGTRLLTSIDLYEISLTATPMHPDARVVSWKQPRPASRCRPRSRSAPG